MGDGENAGGPPKVALMNRGRSPVDRRGSVGFVAMSEEREHRRRSKIDGEGAGVFG